MESDKSKKEQITDENEIDEVLKQGSGGYGYWKREGDLEGLNNIQPQKSDSNSNSNVKVGSAWNTAGTWEEKHYKKSEIEEYLNKVLPEKKFDGFMISKISNWTGDAYTFIVRQKPKLVYDCEFNISIKSTESEEIEGEVSLVDVNNHELEAEFEFTYKINDSTLRTKVKSNKKNIEGLIREAFKSFWESKKI